MTAITVYRPYVIEGVSSSGAHNPIKNEIIALLTGYEADINGLVTSTTGLNVTVAQNTIDVAAATSSANNALVTAASAVAIATSSVVGELVPVRLLTTVDVPTATGMENGDTYDGVVLVTGDHIAKAVTPAVASNGIWVVQASGAAVRRTDADTGAELAYKRFTVSAGSFAGQTWFVQTNPITTINTTPVAIVLSKAADAYSGEVITARGANAQLGQRFDPLETGMTTLKGAKTENFWKNGAPVDGSNQGVITSVYAGAATKSGFLKTVRFFAKAAGTLKIKVFSKSGSVYTLVRSASVATTGTGLKTLTAADFGSLAVNAGEYVGYYIPAGYMTFQTATADGPGYFNITGDGSTATSPTILTAARLQVQMVTEYTELADGDDELLVLSDFTDIKDRLLNDVTTQVIGRASVIASAVYTSSGTYVFDRIAAASGRISTVRYTSGSAGGVVFARTYTRAGDVFTWTGRQAEFNVTGGAGPATAAINLKVYKGEYVGFFQPYNVSLAYTVNTDDQGWFYTAGEVNPFTDISNFVATRLEIGFDLLYYTSTGSAAGVSNLEIAVRTLGGETTPLFIVADGNSLTLGSGGATPWPAQLNAAIGFTGNNKGVSGQTIADMIADASTDIDTLLATPNVRPMLIVWELYNWLNTNAGKTAADAVDQYQTYCNARRAAGWKRILCVNMPAHMGHGTVAVVNSWNAATTPGLVNAELASRWSTFCDGLIDVSPALTDYNDTTKYQSDKIHLTTLGQKHVTNAVRRALATWREF